MDVITCFTHLLPVGERKELTFWDILLDERWTEGNFICPDSVYSEIGDINSKLKVKQNYEFLLRVAEKYPIIAMGSSSCSEQNFDAWDSYCTDCYIVGKYQEKLRENNYFDTFVTILLNQATQMPWKAKGIIFLEEMISHSASYYEIDDNTRPILLYRDSDECSNVLNLFTDCLASALQQSHQRIEIFDSHMEGTQALTKYIGQHFKAIIGVQTYFFAIMMQDGVTNLHDLIIGPKYNIILDHPAWLKDEIRRAPKNYYLMLHDRNYMNFSTQHFREISGCLHFPPAGFIPPAAPIPMAFREYDISFVGTYRNYRERLAALYSYDRTQRHVAARYLKIMHHNPGFPAETALRETLQYYGIRFDNDSFLQIFYNMRQAFFCILLYYREKVLRTLLDAGIEVHVFSESWKNSPFHNHPCLICHPEVEAEVSYKVMQNSKISLNIMSWHKDGLTERIFNSMLCHSVVLSDYTTALQEEFVNGTDILLFSLEQIPLLPAKVKALLDHNEKLQEIAQNGYEKALNRHTWSHRAKQLLQEL